MAEGYIDNPYGMIDKTSDITINTTYITQGTYLWCYVVGKLAVCSINFYTKQRLNNETIISGLPNPVTNYVFSITATENVGGRLQIDLNGNIVVDTGIPSGVWYSGNLVYPIA